MEHHFFVEMLIYWVYNDEKARCDIMLVFTIRECTVSDAVDIAKLNRDEMGYNFDIEETMKKIRMLLCSEKDKILVAEANGIVIGYIHANDYDLLYAPHMKNIMGIAVSSDYRHLGVGRALLQKIEEWASETGAVSVRLVSGAERTAAHEFYRKCGYTQNKQQINFRKAL